MMLICPNCKQTLKKETRCYVCENHHNFDVAKQGYTNLYLHPSKHSGDNKEMVQARTHFLCKEYYRPLLNKLIQIIKVMDHQVIVDAGCGEGYYTNAIESTLHSQVYAFDLSKEALKYAARQNERVHYFVASIFDLPFTSQSSDIVLNIFAPFAQTEFARILKDGGYVIKVDPHTHHLHELKAFLYDHVYPNEILNIDTKEFELQTYHEVTFTMTLTNQDLFSLFQMTPYYYKTKQDKIALLRECKGMDVTASFIIYVYKKKAL